MAKNLTVDSADKSVRWYITPGTASTYDLQVHNDTDRAVLCRVTVQSHPETASVKPQSLTLQAHETRTVAVTFGPNAELPRDRRAVITVKDAAGQTLNTIERELVSGASTDATLALSWKEPIIEEGVLRGFILLCNIRSLSGTADDFTPDFTPHPALSFPSHEPVWLEPGGTAQLELPIRWNRAKRDVEGWNHPRAIEAFVAVSQGRRSTRMVWDVVQRAAGDLLDRADKSPFVERRASTPAFSSNGSTATDASPAKLYQNGMPTRVKPDFESAPPPVVAAVPPPSVIAAPPAPNESTPEPAVAAASQIKEPPVSDGFKVSVVVATPVAPEPSANPSALVETPHSHTELSDDVVPAAAAAASVVEHVDRADESKKVRDIKADVEKNFEGYHPAFQMTTVLPVRAQTGALAVQDQLATDLVGSSTTADDLDSAVVITGRHAIHTIIPNAERTEREKPAISRSTVWVAAGIAAVAAVVIFARPHETQTASAPAPVTAAAAVSQAQTVQTSAPVAARPNVARRPVHTTKASTPAHVAPTAAPAPTPAAQVTAQPVTHQATVVHNSLPTAAPGNFAVLSPRAIARRIAPRPVQVDRSALPEIDAVDAVYTRLGRGVRINWYSYAQAAADVQLTDARGSLIGESSVNGPRSRVLLLLPRGYHGDVYVQVSVTGFHSERVVQTSSLPPF